MLNTSMKVQRPTQNRGFTIIEIIVIISTIGILASIAVVSWNGIKTSSENKTRVSELTQWKNTFELYKTRFAVYPSASANGTFCIGSDFPSGKCGINGNFSQNSGLNTELARTGTLPSNSHAAISTSSTTSYVGPYAVYTTSQIVLTAILKGDSGTCPSDTTYDTASPSGVAYCKITLTR